METTLEYLSRKHRTLVNDYRTPNGKYAESCLIIAVEVGERLTAEGKRPEIREVSDLVREKGVIHTKDLIPVMFRKKWKEGWGCHLVCCESGLAYDPLLGKPVSTRDYSMMMFGENYPLRLFGRAEDFTQVANRQVDF